MWNIFPSLFGFDTDFCRLWNEQIKVAFELRISSLFADTIWTFFFHGIHQNIRNPKQRKMSEIRAFREIILLGTEMIQNEPPLPFFIFILFFETAVRKEKAQNILTLYFYGIQIQDATSFYLLKYWVHFISIL